MIVGTGDIGRALLDIEPRADLCFFASGVSNSNEQREQEYEREKNLLKSQRVDRRLVYFSSLSIFYKEGRYQKHKREMEELVKKRFNKWCIVRIGNIAWGDNPNTFINYIRNKIENKEPYELLSEYRYVVEKDEFLHWMELMPDWNCELNIPGQRMTVGEAVTKYVWNK